MTCRSFVGSLFNILNFFIMLTGLSMAGCGLYRLLIWNQHTKNLSLAWFPFLLIAVGSTVFIISCLGSIGVGTKNKCCLSSYSVFMVILILLEGGLGTLILLDHNWKQRIPTEKTGNLNSISSFVESKWNIMKWVALGGSILEVLALILAILLNIMIKSYRVKQAIQYA